eukprot:jgi/Picsp_1/4138/NSC_01647-R1_fe-only
MALGLRMRSCVEGLTACRSKCMPWSSSFDPFAAAAISTNVAEKGEEFAKSVQKVGIVLNGHKLEVTEGITILEAARQANSTRNLDPHNDPGENGIYIPTICTDPRLPHSPGTCRLCLVEASGKLVPACATPVNQGMSIETDTDRVRTSVRTMLSLLKANHKYDCMTCEAAGRCEFQDLIKRYNIASGYPGFLPKGMDHEWDNNDGLHDTSSASIEIDLEKCIKCGRCITACGLVQTMNVIGWQGRGSNSHPAVMTENLDSSQCISCGQCSAVCPVAAIKERSEWRQVMDELEDKRKVMVAMTAPSVRVALGEEVGLGPGTITSGQMVTAQRMLGFDHVFDVNFAADLTIMEEGTELIQRLLKKWSNDPNVSTPMFTSCCPAWVNLVEKSHPELINNLSTCKSPQQMLGAVVKNYFATVLGKPPSDICVVSFMPCTAKKYEAERKEMHTVDDTVQDVDYVLTTREFGQMLRLRRIPLGSLEESEFDSPLSKSSGGAMLFGASGGVMESALRTCYELVTGAPLPRLELEELRGAHGVKMATVEFPAETKIKEFANKKVRVGVTSGIGNVRHLLENLKEDHFDFIEVMACPSGCIGGGGQPKKKDADAVLKRMGSVYAIDSEAKIRKAHENKDILLLYETYLGDYGGEKAHKLLHTHYTDRSGNQ